MPSVYNKTKELVSEGLYITVKIIQLFQCDSLCINRRCVKLTLCLQYCMLHVMCHEEAKWSYTLCFQQTVFCRLFSFCSYSLSLQLQWYLGDYTEVNNFSGRRFGLVMPLFKAPIMSHMNMRLIPIVVLCRLLHGHQPTACCH